MYCLISIHTVPQQTDRSNVLIQCNTYIYNVYVRPASSLEEANNNYEDIVDEEDNNDEIVLPNICKLLCSR